MLGGVLSVPVCAADRPGVTAASETVSFSDGPRDITRAAGNTEPSLPGTVLALAFSPDGTTMALAGEDPVVALRDSSGNRTRASLSGHTEPLTCLAFSPDGTTLAGGGFDRNVRLWDLADAAERTALAGHAGWVFAVAFSPDGATLASAGQDKTVKLWDVASGRALATLSGHSGPVRALAFSPDGTALASAGADRAVRLWDVAGRSPRGEWNGHRGAVRALAFSPDGTTLASASEDHTVRLWDVATGRPRATLAGHTDMILALAFSPRGTALVSGGYDGTVRIWHPSGVAPVATLRGHAEGVTALAFDPVTGSLVSAGYERTVRLWSRGTPFAKLSRAITPPPGGITTIAFSPDGKALLTVGGLFTNGGEPFVRVWDAASYRERGKLEGHSGNILAAAFSPDGRRILSWSTDQTIRLWDARSRAPVAVVPNGGGPRVYTPFAFTPDGSTLAVSTDAKSVVLWDLPDPNAGGKPGEGVAELKPGRTLFDNPNDLITALAVSPDGRTLAVTVLDRASRTGQVSVRDLADGRERVRLSLRSQVIGRVAFSPDGRLLAVAFLDATPGGELGLTVWDTGTWKQAATVPSRPPARAPLSMTAVDREVQIASLSTLAFTPDGSRIALANGQGSVVFRDSASLAPRGELRSHDVAVTGLSFGPDGRTLVTAAFGAGEPAKVWSLAREGR
jgi:WD40 repeat protein